MKARLEPIYRIAGLGPIRVPWSACRDPVRDTDTPFYAWWMDFGGGEMGVIVRPERNFESAGLPEVFCLQNSGRASATTMKPEQIT